MLIATKPAIFTSPPDHGRCGALFHRRVGRRWPAASPRPTARLAVERGPFRRDGGLALAHGRGAWRASPMRWPCSTWRRRWPSSRPPALCAGPAVDDEQRFRIARRAPSGGRGRPGAAQPRRASSPTTATFARRQGPAVAGDRPQHGGQVHLPAPERADRDSGPDGQLRARRHRPDRPGRPALFSRVGAADDLARGPLDLHGRDGRDRRDPESGDGAEPGDPGRDRPRHRHL